MNKNWTHYCLISCILKEKWSNNTSSWEFPPNIDRLGMDLFPNYFLAPKSRSFRQLTELSRWKWWFALSIHFPLVHNSCSEASPLCLFKILQFLGHLHLVKCKFFERICWREFWRYPTLDHKWRMTCLNFGKPFQSQSSSPAVIPDASYGSIVSLSGWVNSLLNTLLFFLSRI